MEMNVLDNQKRVEVWLSHADASSTIIQCSLKAMCTKYKAQGYRVAVFESGQRDLFATTRDLLLENRTQSVSRIAPHSAR
jgi:hypothetical protein